LLLGLFLISPTQAAGQLEGIKVCLDPGHGGSDPGATNGDLYERDINLDVSYGIKSLLVGQGAEVVMTRTGDSYNTNSDRYTFCNEEQATILVSVHTNSVIDPTWDGSMSLYAPNRDPDLAMAIHEVMYPFLRDTAPVEEELFRDFGLDHFASGVLFKCDMPAAMLEPLFMSHPAEAALLVTPIYDDAPGGVFNDGCSDYSCRRGQVAQAIYLGVLNFFGNGQPATMLVGNIDMAYRQKGVNYFVDTSVLIQDEIEGVVAGATVEMTIELPDGSTTAQTALTDDNGMAIFVQKSKLPGFYTSTITDVSKTGWFYDSSLNLETSETLVVP
jgi:N-acetylmuramoyl-L-alanine amidase